MEYAFVDAIHSEIVRSISKILFCSLLICGGGVIGGFSNYLIDQLNPHSGKKMGAFSYMFVGTSAAFVVPLFLQMAQSDLLARVLSAPTSGGEARHAGDIFVLLAFCILAAFSSRAFMQTMLKKMIASLDKTQSDVEALKGKTEEVDSKADAAKAIAREASESSIIIKEVVQEISESPSDEPEGNDSDLNEPLIKNQEKTSETRENSGNSSEYRILSLLSQSEKTIMKSLASKIDIWRLPRNISNDTNIPVMNVIIKLKEMEKKGIVKSKIGKNDNRLYMLTDIGTIIEEKLDE